MKKHVRTIFLFLILGITQEILAQSAPYDPIKLMSQADAKVLEEKYSGEIVSRNIKIAGWSKSGYLAYFVEELTGESDAGYFENMYIQYLVTDEILFQTHYTINDWLKERSTSIFAEKGKFEGITQKYGVIIQKETLLYPKNSVIDGKGYRIKVRITKRGAGYYKEDTVIGYSVYVISGNKEKLVGKFKVSPCMGIEVLGFIKSPYENRAAIIIGEIRHGWEGPPHSVDYQVIGCDLKKGI